MCWRWALLTCIRKFCDLIAGSQGRYVTSSPISNQWMTTKFIKCCRGVNRFGVFQVESRAQMNMTATAEAAEIYDLVIEGRDCAAGSDPG